MTNKERMRALARSGKVKTTLIIPDIHFQSPLDTGDGYVAPEWCHDPEALSLMFQVARDLNPDQIIQLGDVAEMECVSMWAEKAGRAGDNRGIDGKYYKASWKRSLAMVENFWRYIRKTYPKATLHQLEGNHDFWAKIAFEKPAMEPFREDLGFREQPFWNELGIEFKNYDGVARLNEQPVIRVGRVRVMHGYGNASAKRLRQERNNVIYGHQHKKLYDSWDANDEETKRAWCIGCLTFLDPRYNSLGGRLNGWVQGFAVLYTMPDETFDVQMVEIISKIDKETARHYDPMIIDFRGKTYFPKPLGEIDPLLKCMELPEDEDKYKK